MPLGSGGPGTSGDISGSVDSEDLGSGVSGLSGSGIILISGRGQYSGLWFALYIYTDRKKCVQIVHLGLQKLVNGAVILYLIYL